MFLQPPATNEMSTRTTASSLVSFNRDEYNLRRKQVKINSLLKMTSPQVDSEEEKPEKKQQEKTIHKEDLIKKENEVVLREKRSYAPIEEIRLRRLSRQRNRQIIFEDQPPMGPPAGAKLSKSMEKLSEKPEEEPRKTSLPSNMILESTIKKPKNWLKDKSWLQETCEKVVSTEKRMQLKEWLLSCNSSDLMDLQIQLDWENNKPSKTAGSKVDPYNPIRSEKYLVESPEHLEVLQGFSGLCSLTLSNGDHYR